MPGAPLAGQPGYPELPLYSGLVGLPAGGGARLRVVEIEREIVELPHPPLPAPAPQPLLVDPQSPPAGGPTARRPDPAVYAANAFYPSEVAELGLTQQLRDRRVARLLIHPLRVNPVAGQLEIIRSLRLEISFEQPARAADLNSQGGANPSTGPSSGSGSISERSPFTLALAARLLNPQASGWAAAPASPASVGTESIGALSGGDSLFKVTVNQAGLYALTYNDLAAGGGCGFAGPAHLAFEPRPAAPGGRHPG
jgi:hypothetical protein